MELSKNYIPLDVETRWNDHWAAKGYFNSRPDGRPSYTIVIPPPNVTGVLHMGHTLNETVQDILVRKARMEGFNACWVPGSDHASIATEAKVVGMLKERGIEKRTLSREKYMEYAFEWKEKYGGIIYQQIKRLGCSVDWNRVAFTMDKDYYAAVIKVFVDLYQKGLVYRGARMIHWDPQARTALSDEEVLYKDVQGTLYYVKYQIEGEDESIMIATQRPETIMGDTGICVNPADERYARLKGKYVIVPLVNRRVPVIFDDYVDPAFGTGALKVTPAHDINDYNLGLKYSLPTIDTLNEDGTLSIAAEIFVGMDRFEARKKVVERLREEGLLEREEDYMTRLGFSERTNAIIEPRISTQWFVRMQSMAQPALQAVLNGEIRLHPGERFIATYKYWLENVEDWCISRQLWWGQRIPAWFDDEGHCFVAETEEKARELAAREMGHSTDGGGREAATIQLTQDEDVLDTWFSSWLWPIEVFKGLTQPGNADIRYYYPTKVLVTAPDIIYLWVARMIMAGFEYMGQKPFSDVYFTGTVRDKQGRKMSKSLGNSPDLLDLIDRFGADAVRFGIMISSPAGNDLLFDEASLEQGRNFNNKLWNALKLVKMWGDKVQPVKNTESITFALQWFENRLGEVRGDVERLLKEYKLSEALKTIYSLIWDDFCSWYLEWVKPAPGESISAEVYNRSVGFFERLLQLLHPFMPFITEEIYHLLKDRKEGDDLCILQFQAFPEPARDILSEGEFLKVAITDIRNLKAKGSFGVFSVYLTNNRREHLFPLIQKNTKIDVHFSSSSPTPPGAINVLIAQEKAFILSEKPVDAGLQKNEILKELAYLKGFLNSVEKKLGNDKFVQNAKPELVQFEQKKKADAEAKIRVLEESLASL